jgi:hypothetical protein
VDGCDESGEELVAAAFGFAFGFIGGPLTAYASCDNWIVGGFRGSLNAGPGPLGNRGSREDPQVWENALYAGIIGAGYSVMFTGLAKGIASIFGDYVSIFGGDEDVSGGEEKAGGLAGTFAGELSSFALGS